MGIHLRPGHVPEEGKKGWTPTGYDDFLRDIKIGVLDLGYWGKQIDNSIDAPDAHSPIYSIPNPWASAYLFNYVMSDNTHPLAESLIIQMLNLLSDFAIYDALDLIELNKPSGNTPFSKIWSMAPDFITYNNSIWFFKNKSTKEIVGGLSQSSLVWTSQQYEGKRNKSELITDENLILYLRNIKDQNRPKLSYNAFWMHSLLNQMINKEISYGNLATLAFSSPESWTKKIPPSGLQSDFFDGESECIVLDESSLVKGRQIFSNTINPHGFIDELKNQKYGDRLPMNMGDCKWVVLDSLLEPFWIKNDKVESSVNEFVHSFEKGFLYPVKPEYISKFKLKLRDLKIDRIMNIGPQNARSDIIWKDKRKLTLNTQFQDDARSLAIWPPFMSQYTVNYIIEYSLAEPISNLENIEFYNENGKKINCSMPKYYKGQNFRIYELAEKEFPKYVRIIRKNQNTSFGGFIEIIEREKSNSQGRMTIGVDFGTSHTSIYYCKFNNIEQMSFINAIPIIITDNQSRFGVLYHFIKMGLASKKPSTQTEWDQCQPWQPFQTQWMEFSKGNKKAIYIQDGIIPFLYYASDTNPNPIIENLKWGTTDDISTYRDLFLEQLILMAIVEAEAIGFENLKINWSYPKAFSVPQKNAIESSWKKIADKFNLNII